jgi:hypothetical protein
MCADADTTPLSLKRQPWRARTLLDALERCWQAITRRHPDLPPVVITVGAGELARGRGLRLGRFSPCSWQLGDDELGEVFVGAEGLARGAEPVLATLLHEAAHGLAHQRDIRDVSRGRRYHNRRYRTLAETVGLEVAHHPQLGWSTTTLTPAAHGRYEPQLRVLEQALAGHRQRHHRTAGRSGRNLQACGCSCGRRIRASAQALAQGPILCSLCGQPFIPNPSTG